MLIIENCTSNEIENYKKMYNLKLNWWSQNPEENQCYKIIQEGEAIAMIEFGIDLLGYTLIDNFEVFKKGKGYGKNIIKAFISNKKTKYCLYSKDTDSNRFWESVGFILRNDGLGVPMFYSE